MSNKNTSQRENTHIINAMKLVCCVTKDVQLAEIVGSKSGTGNIVTNARAGGVPSDWYPAVENYSGANRQAIFRLVEFAEQPAKILENSASQPVSAYDVGMDELFAEIKRWWASTDDPTVQGFTLSFAERFPDYKKWRQDRIDIKNHAGCGAAVEITESA